MKTIALIISIASIIVVPLQVWSQIYRGGSNDGQSGITAGNFDLTVSSSLYKGGTGDGYAFVSAGTVNLTTTSTLYKGGTGDGYAIASAGSLNLSTAGTLYKGGTGDGYTIAAGSFNLTVAGALYKGGSNRGEFQLTTPGVNLAVCGDIIVWNGNYDINWDNPANWDCGIVPGTASIVIIPSAKPRYPTVRFNTEIKRLELRTGSNLIINSGRQLKINGQ